MFLALHGYFNNPETHSRKPATYYSTLKFEADDALAAKNNTLQFNHVTPDSPYPYPAHLPSKNSPVLLTKNPHDPIQTYSMVPHHSWHSPQKQICKKCFAHHFINLFRRIKVIPKKLSTNNPHKTFEILEFHEPQRSNFINKIYDELWTNYREIS